MLNVTSHRILLYASFVLATSTLIISLGSLNGASAGVRGLYVGDDYISNLNPSLIATTKVSGYNTLIIFTLNVTATGDITGPANELLVTNGTYVGNASWGAQLAALKAAPSPINRIEMCLGGWGGVSFPDIQSLVNSQGTGSGSILYRNFQALHNATGVDAIDFDDETTYDLNTSVPFGRMLSSLGMWVSLSPYQNQGYWVSLLADLGPFNANGGIVDAVYLQCYDGGAGNDPGNWISALGGFNKVYPGLWTNVEVTPSTGLSTVSVKLRNWQASDGITGGFIWDNESDPSASDPWAQALKYGIDEPYFNIINKFSGNSMDLIGGNGADQAPINLWASDSGSLNQRWALVPTENGNHFKLIAWDTGYAASISTDSTALGAALWDYGYTGNDAGQQFDLVDAGNGWFKIRNVNSGLVLDDLGYGTGNNNVIDQWSDNSTNGSGADPDNQLWKLQPSSNFSYFIRANTGGGQYICCQGESPADGTAIIQYQWQNNPWFQWNFSSDVDGWFSLFGQNSPGRVICVDNGSYTAAAGCNLWDYNVNNFGDQRIRIEPKTDGNFKFYWEHDGMSWDVPGGAVGNLQPLQQYPDNTNYWQEFSIERTP